MCNSRPCTTQDCGLPIIGSEYLFLWLNYIGEYCIFLVFFVTPPKWWWWWWWWCIWFQHLLIYSSRCSNVVWQVSRARTSEQWWNWKHERLKFMKDKKKELFFSILRILIKLILIDSKKQSKLFPALTYTMPSCLSPGHLAYCLRMPEI